MRGLGRKLRQTFGISAPRMAVRTHLSWRWKIPAMLALLVLVVGMWWWGFDFGQFLSGFNRSRGRGEASKAGERRRAVQGGKREASGACRATGKRSQHHARRAGDAVEAIARASVGKHPDQGRARFPAETVQRHRQAGHDFHSAALAPSESATTHTTTACWSFAAAIRRTSLPDS